MRKATATPTAAPWWEGALAGFAGDAKRWLRLKFPALRAQHEDLVSEAVAQLARQMMVPGAHAPASWFAASTPPLDDIRRFHGLAYTVLSRRVTDVFRSDTTSWLQSLDDVPEWQWPADGAPDALTRLAHVRIARALVEALQTLSPRDQMLIEQVVNGEQVVPMSGADRERLRVVRMKLRHRLGPLLDDLTPTCAPIRRSRGSEPDDA